MRVIVADHHPQALRSVRLMLQEATEFDVVGEATDAEHLLKLTEEFSADLVLVDWDLPAISIEDLIAHLHSLESKPAVVVMSAQHEYGRRPLRAGADAFVSKRDDPSWLMDTLRNCAARSTK